jgi:hypothetical protein
MIELSKVLCLQNINKYFTSAGCKDRELSYKDANDDLICFTSEQKLSEKQDHLEFKLAPE